MLFHFVRVVQGGEVVDVSLCPHMVAQGIGAVVFVDELEHQE
jgi:hypothetical protein